MQNEDDTESPETRTRRKKRGTGFPVVSLAEASKLLKAAGRYGLEPTLAELASYMGHSTTNSGAFRQRLAAFRDWRLITGRGDEITFTDLGRTIALPPDNEAERDALIASFTSCTVFNRLYEDSQKDTPLERERLGNRAVHALGISPASTAKFIDSFVESAVAAGLAQEENDRMVVLRQPSGAQPGGRAEGVDHPTAHIKQLTDDRSREVDTASAPIVHQAWPIDDGTIVFEIRSRKPLPASVYSVVGEVVGTLERLSTSLLSKAETSAGDAPDEQQ